MDQLSKSKDAPKKIAHIGIAVKNLHDSINFYTDLLGLTLERVEEVASEQVRVAFLKIGESRIELLEPLSNESPIYRFIHKKGEGIHHIALEVNNINDRLANLKSNGIQLINEQAKEGADNAQIAFLHPKSTNGVLFELCQHQNKE
ncbi:methylmalonyl-CoA epimerase [Pseudogracilibacillus sp. SE30717A]|uniref:methylmalonyl-CoA epimerase n=1 Tax=Pseudogracilibacillus sp. SE30717A TaxID=3098293 RepID=UPI00300E26E5